MRTTTFLLVLLLLAAAAMAQTPQPMNLRANLDEGNTVTLDWMPPVLSPEYMEDFEDGEAQGWSYQFAPQWSVADGKLRSAFDTIGGWVYAYYTAETFGDGIYETSVQRIDVGPSTMGSLGNAMILFANDDVYPDSLSSGLMFWVNPSTYPGSPGTFTVLRFIDGAIYRTVNARPSETVNNGVGAINVLSVAQDGPCLAFYINGQEVFTWYEEIGPLSGYVGVAAGAMFPYYGVVEWEYVAHDASAQRVAADAAAPDPSALEALLAQIDPMQPAAQSGTPAKSALQRAAQPLNGGFFAESSGARELDEFQHYRIYRNGSFVATSEIETYTETVTEYGRHDYLVTANYDEGESVADTAWTVYMDPVNIVLDESFDTGLPEDWQITGNQPVHTWHLDEGDERALFDTPYMLVDDDASGGLNLEERLITPEIGVANASRVILEFDHLFVYNFGEHGWLQYRINGGPWEYALSAHTNLSPDSSHVRLDMTEMLDGAAVFEIAFYYSDFLTNVDGLYWGVDNVLVYVQDASSGPVELSLNPQNTVFPAAGGTLFYDVDLESMLPGAYPGVSYWTDVITPTGAAVGPLQTIPFTLQPFMDITVFDMWATVPPGAPAGEYTFSGHVGYPGGMSVNDSFTFMKATGVAGGAADWRAGGDWVAESSTADITPAHFQLHDAYPNPFNPATTIEVTLPEAAELRVHVFDITGREVSELAKGWYAAGSHRLQFDASTLASGVYFVRATVPGKLNQTRKLVYLR